VRYRRRAGARSETLEPSSQVCMRRVTTAPARSWPAHASSEPR